MAARHGRIVALLEPTALYHQRDLFEPGDEAWTSDWPDAGELALPGAVGLAGPHDAAVLIVTAGNGVRLSLRAARSLQREHDLGVQVLDVRWLAPLPVSAVLEAAHRVGRVLVVDECRASGGWADAMVAGLVTRGFTGPVATVTAADSYVPIGPAAPSVLISQDEVEATAREVARR
jgi:2-oxoisovalerate dehydrogenase E1 component